MNIEKLAMSDNYRVAVRGLRELHRQDVAGLQQSGEADEIRDEMDVPWAKLTEAERSRLRGLSEDLYSVAEQSPVGSPLKSLDSRSIDLLRDLNESIESSESWDQAFQELRTIADAFHPASLSYVRGRLWNEAGDAETATIFLDHASNQKIETQAVIDSILSTVGVESTNIGSNP